MNNSLVVEEEQKQQLEATSNTAAESLPVSEKQISSQETVVKWLYPRELQEEEEAAMASQEEDVKAVVKATEEAKDTVAANDKDDNTSLNSDDIEEIDVTEEITKQVTAGASYVGNMFSSAWNKTQKAAGSAADSGLKVSTSLFNFAAGYDLNKPSDDEDEECDPDKNQDNQEGTDESNAKVTATKPPPKSSSSFFSSAMSKFEDLTTTWSSTDQGQEGQAAAAAADKDGKAAETAEGAAAAEGGEKKKPAGGWTAFGGLGDLSNIVKVATDATSVIKAKVQSTTLLSEFNREQEEFIKNKGEDEKK